jgi:hypothetical protein
MSDDPQSQAYSYSVSFRLQREITEVAFVSVPITEDLLIIQPDGTRKIDVTKTTHRAVELGNAPTLTWMPEGQQIRPHPIQTPPPNIQTSN